MKQKGAKIRKGKKMRVEIVYIPKSKWPKSVLKKLRELGRIRNEDGKNIRL